jgi:hypothetical protein
LRHTHEKQRFSFTKKRKTEILTLKNAGVPLVTQCNATEKPSAAEHIQMQTKKSQKWNTRMQLRFIQVPANMQLKYK